MNTTVENPTKDQVYWKWGFPFDDDRNRTDIRSYLDEIASRHPEFAEHFREPGWNEDFPSSSLGRKRRGSNSERENEFSPKAGPTQRPLSPSPLSNYTEVQEPQQNLTNFGLRNTVPLGPGVAFTEEDRRQRSMSAPPDDRTPNKPKRYITKCEIPVMHDPTKEPKPDSGVKVNQENAQKKSNNAPNVRVIPIQVEGRDTPLVNTNIDTSTNFGAETYGTPKDGMFEGRLPRDFGTYQKHSPRFGHKERSSTPPQFQQYAPHYQQYVPPSHQPFMPGPQHQFAPHQQFGPPPQPQHPTFAQQQSQKPATAPHPQHQQQQHQHQKQTQPQRSPSTQSQNDEIDSRRSPQPPHPKPEPIKDPIEKVQLIQKEVEELMKQVESFKGNSRSDKQYLTLDELLTRQLLLLDNIDTEGKENVRQARKDTIRSIQRCISTLENKVPLTETKEETEGAKSQEGAEGAAKPAEQHAVANPQAMEVDQTKENTPVDNNRENQSMELDVKENTATVQPTEENVQQKV